MQMEIQFKHKSCPKDKDGVRRNKGITKSPQFGLGRVVSFTSIFIVHSETFSSKIFI